MLFSFVLMNSKTKAHAVQVGYCVNCNGDLRIWIEHWHNNANPQSTTMTLQINVGGIITSYTAPPDTSVLNTPVGQLPGCFTPMTVFSQCQGTGIYAPNSHNDWIAYDFYNLACAVPITVTIISGNSAFTMDCGNPVNMFPVTSPMFSVPCMADIDTCAGNTIGPFAFPPGNTWTNSNTAIGLGASGNGNIPAFIGAYNSTPQTATIVTNNTTCGYDTFDIIVRPAAQVNFDAIVGCPGQPVTFTNNTTSLASLITNWLWDYGDGSPNDTIQNPGGHTFPGAGPYTVTLTVTTANGCVNDTVVTVSPLGGLVVGFYAASVCDGSPTTFVDTTNGVILKYEWDFDNNGIVDDTTQNPTHLFTGGPGIYNVKLHVDAQGGCQDSIVIPIIVNPNPVVNFSVTDACMGNISNFYDSTTVFTGNITTWSWDFGDAIGTSALQNPTYTYTSTGMFPVSLTVTSDSGCVTTYTDSARVTFLPTADFLTDNVCLNISAAFFDNSNGNGSPLLSWEWDFDNNGIFDDTLQNPTNSFPAAGTYNVKLLVSTGVGCSDSIIKPIVIHPMPVSDFTWVNTCLETPMNFTDISNVAAPGTINTWAWNFGNTVTSTLQHPTENYATEGMYLVELTVTTDSGCSNTMTHQVEVWPNPVVDFIPTDICPNVLSPFTDLSTISSAITPNSIIQWTWDFGDGIGTSTSQNPNYSYGQEGTYPCNLTVVSNNGCTHDTTINVTLHPLPQINFGADSLAGCAPITLNFYDSTIINNPGSLFSWYWNFGNGQTSTVQNPTGITFINRSPSGVATYGVSLTIISDEGCIAKDSVINMISAYPMPIADFTFTPDYSNTYDRNVEFTDRSVVGSVWDWDLGDGTTSTMQNPLHEYPDTGTYIITLYMENQYGCKDTTEKTITINPVFVIWIPNSFSPNADGINDDFFATGYGIIELHTQIFDRWGTLIFEGNSMRSKWNGGYKGKTSVVDTYVYKIRALDVFDEWHEFVGKINLLK